MLLSAPMAAIENYPTWIANVKPPRLATNFGLTAVALLISSLGDGAHTAILCAAIRSDAEVID